MPSVLTDFQENWEPLRYPSFCLLAARGQPEALRWEAYFPVMWPWPSHPGTGHLRADRGDMCSCLAAHSWWLHSNSESPDSTRLSGQTDGKREWTTPPRGVRARFTLADTRPGPASANETPPLGRTTALMEEICQVSGKLQGFFKKAIS